MACIDTYATVRIFVDSLDVQEVSSLLKIEPTIARVRDEDSRYKHRREHGLWSWSTQNESDSLVNSDHVKIIVSKFQDKVVQLEELRALNCETDVFCFWSFDSQGGFGLDVASMQDLVSLGFDISWDIYGND